jgi:hypothetical protein
MQILSFEERADGQKEANSIYYFKANITVKKKQYSVECVFLPNWPPILKLTGRPFLN